MPRKLPNIVITGTPGVGKTTTSTLLVSLSADTPYPLKHVAVNDLVKLKGFHEGYDDRLQTLIVDEDKILDELEVQINDGEDGDDEKVGGGYILDWHVCDLFPERWVDLVVVLRCPDTGVFHDRLAGQSGAHASGNQDGVDGSKESGKGRGYEGEKLQENIDAEIFGVVAEEAKEGYPGEGRVVELESVNAEDVDANCERVLEWIKNWVEDQKQGAHG